MNILLINPWIYDFAAYDLWMKPWGLLKISSILKKNGFHVNLIDTLDRHHPVFKGRAGGKDHPDGTGKYVSREIEKPAILKHVPRKYKRYGMSVEDFEGLLPSAAPDIILVSSVMTYWYPGVFKAIEMLRAKFPGTPIVLGGSYATLCREHAVKNSGADKVIDNFSLDSLAEMLGKGVKLSFQAMLDAEIDYSFYPNTAYGVLRLSLGCPFDCSYCAQKNLGPAFTIKDMDRALSEIKTLYDSGIKKFAFYDDALLYDREYFLKYTDRVLTEGIKTAFYTPNGLHARFITKDIARMLKQAGFINPVISFETADENVRIHDKVETSEFRQAVLNLKEAGYLEGEYSAYILLGAPSLPVSSVKNAIDYAYGLGAKSFLSEFSPVPQTLMGKEFTEKDPLLHNNSIFPFVPYEQHGAMQKIKDYAKLQGAGLRTKNGQVWERF